MFGWLVALLIVGIALFARHHAEKYVSSVYDVNWGVGSHAAWGGAEAAGGLFARDEPRGQTRAGALLDSYGV